jgi:hypothetical protein
VPWVEQENRRCEISSQLGQGGPGGSPRDRGGGDLEVPPARGLERGERGGVAGTWKGIDLTALPRVTRVVEGLPSPALAENSLHHSRRDHVPTASGGHEQRPSHLHQRSLASWD